MAGAGWKPKRRFWTEVSVRNGEAGGFTVHLDERPLRTPAQAILVARTSGLAEAVAEEWRALVEEIDPERLPLTRALNTALDRVARDHDQVVDSLAAYGDADLLCYRAEAPEELVQRQSALWDPWLVWSDRVLGAPLTVTRGLMHVPQPEASLRALRAAVAAHDALRLTALHDLVTLSGSLVLGLAVSLGALAAPEGWALSRVDDDFQSGQWGIDDEAAAHAALKASAFLRADQFARLAGAGESGDPR